MNTRVMAFGRFWQKFIIGDDWTFAVAVMWSLIGLYALNYYEINLWYALPLIIALTLGWSVWRVACRSSGHAPRPPHRVQLWLPLAGVLVLPLVLFRVSHGDNSLVDTVIPTVLNAGVATVVSLGLFRFYPKHPFLTSVTAAIMAILTFNYLEAPFIQISLQLNQLLPGEALLPATLLLGLLVVFGLFL